MKLRTKLSTAVLIAFGLNAYLFAQSTDDTYVLTTSEQGTSFLFEKANSSETEQTYTLQQEVTDKGVEFHFVVTDSTTPSNVSYWYANKAVLSSSSEEAAQDCREVAFYGGNWRSPTVDEVSGAISNLDADFLDVMHSLGGDSYIARGYIKGGSYVFSNSTNKGRADSSALTGNNPTLCVKD